MTGTHPVFRRAALLVPAAVLLLAGCSTSVAGSASPASSPGGPGTTSSSSSGSSSASSPPPSSGGGTVSCDFAPDTSGSPNLVDVGTPPDQVAGAGQVTLSMVTDVGTIGLTLDAASAPCASASFSYLAQQAFFDGSPCHREVNEPTFGVLQCGDPSGTGSGGPSYKFGQEVTADTTYPRGTVAMANSGQPNSTGSQFFLSFVDTDLSPDYTVVGAVDQPGLAVLDQVAAAGNDGSLDPSPGGGAPNLPVTIRTMTVTS